MYLKEGLAEHNLLEGCRLQSDFGRACVVAVIVLGTVACRTREAAAESKSAPARPNIVIILADDLGFSDVGCFGSEVATPNIDRLAANGMRISQFYNCARCCPTRAALLTGLFPHQAGVGHMLEDFHAPGYTNGLNERCVTIAQLLHGGGYRTYHVGKWHVGGVGRGDARNHPMNRGFDHARGTEGGGNYFRLHPLYNDRKMISLPPDFYATDNFADWAVELLEQHGREHSSQPFFLHLCFTAPHFPLQARPADIARHRGNYRAGWDVAAQYAVVEAK